MEAPDYNLLPETAASFAVVSGSPTKFAAKEFGEVELSKVTPDLAQRLIDAGIIYLAAKPQTSLAAPATPIAGEAPVEEPA